MDISKSVPTIKDHKIANKTIPYKYIHGSIIGIGIISIQLIE